VIPPCPPCTVLMLFPLRISRCDMSRISFGPVPPFVRVTSQPLGQRLSSMLLSLDRLSEPEFSGHALSPFPFFPCYLRSTKREWNPPVRCAEKSTRHPECPSFFKTASVSSTGTFRRLSFLSRKLVNVDMYFIFLFSHTPTMLA